MLKYLKWDTLIITQITLTFSDTNTENVLVMPGALFFFHTARKTFDVLVVTNCENFSTCPYVGLIVIVT